MPTPAPIQLDEPAVERAAAALGAELDRLGLATGDRLALLCGNAPEFFAARDAAAARGVWVAPLNSRLAPPELAAILAASGARALAVHRDLAGRVPRGDIPAIELPAAAAAGVGSRPAGAPPASTGATVLFTSGTTGTPRGCLRTEEQERARAAELRATYSIGSADTHLVACPLAHSAPGIFARAARQAGAATVLLPRFSPAEFLAAVGAFRATLFFLVPTQISRLLSLSPEERARADLSSVRAVIVAGAPFSPALKRRAIEWIGEGRLWEFYGSSETGTVTVLGPDEQLSHPGSVGRPPPGVELRLLGPGGEPVAPGEIGEVFVRSPSVMSGYIGGGGDWRDGFLSVGDLGRLDAAGHLTLVDRKHDTIISGGVNVHPADVERALAHHPHIAGAVAFGVADVDLGQIVAVAIAPAPGADPTARQILDFLRDHLAGYKLPRALAFVDLDELPIGPSGKPERRRAARELAGRLEPTKAPTS